MPDDLDFANLADVRTRVVQPVIDSLLRPEELDDWEVRLDPPKGIAPAHEDDVPEVWLVLVAAGESFQRRLGKVTEELWDASDVAGELYSDLVYWLPETRFAWGQLREGGYTIHPLPPARDG